MSRFKRPFLASHSFYKSLYNSPLCDSSSSSVQHQQEIQGKPSSSSSSSSSSLSSASGLLCRGTSVVCDVPCKENRPPISASKGGTGGKSGCREAAVTESSKEASKRYPLHPLAPHTEKEEDGDDNYNDNDDDDGTLLFPPPTPNHFSHVWDDPGSDAAPASAWSALSNRSLLCRPLPLDVGRCISYIVQESNSGGKDGPATVYSLYTDEGHGRQDRKLAVARHRRRSGCSEFIISQSHLAEADDGFLGRVRANLLGSRYIIWDEHKTATGNQSNCPKQILGVVEFEPTVTTLTGTYRVMRAYIPKYQSMQITNATQHERNGLAKDWKENVDKVFQLCSRRPCYNRESRRYELDFRDRAKRSAKIRTSRNNFQLSMEEGGKQAILLLGKVGKSKYVMEYSFPLTAYQAFSICLASLDSKLCCSV